MANREHEYILLSGVDKWHEFIEKEENKNRLKFRADLQGADLGLENLQGANLQVADLQDAIIVGTNLQGADLHVANLQDANLRGADLQGANLRGADLQRADLQGANLQDANLQGASLRDCKNYLLDNNFIKDTLFSPNASDPWSVLRRKYTGVMLFFNFLFLICFLGSNALQATAWKALNIFQKHYAENIAKLENISEIKTPLGACMSEKCDNPRPIWQIMLGLQKGWLKAALAVLLIVYNISRAWFTWWVGLLREAEERSNHSPSLKQYIWWYRGHLFFMLPMVIFATTSLLIHGYDLLVKTTVILPLVQ